MSLFRLIFGIVLLVLIYFAVREWKKLRMRGKAENALEQIQAEEDAIDITEEVELRRQDLEKRKKGLLELNGEEKDKK